MKKPEFPKPRLIREDFLPDKPMNKYRIVKKTKGDRTRYYPQVKFLFWWYNPFKWEPYNDGHFYSLEVAQKELCEYIRQTTVEYIDFDYKSEE